MSPDAHVPAGPILERARALGFALAGICDARPSEHADAVRAWFRAGKHGSMHWLADELEVRLDPGKLLPGARSVICLADRYSRGARDATPEEIPTRGRIARYARGRDYHLVIRRRLRRFARELRASFPEAEFRIACDLLPVLERELAARSGIGAIGKHTLLLARGEGSYFALGEIVTTLAIADEPRADASDPCGTCTRCIDACPTRAIEPFTVDASRCLAYTTIEHDGPIEPELAERTGDWLFGCDICQEVCPHNLPTRRRARAVVRREYEETRRDVDLLEVLRWTASDRERAVVGTALKRASLANLKRNAIVILGNGLARRADPEIRARLRAIAEDPAEDPAVRETAARALR